MRADAQRRQPPALPAKTQRRQQPFHHRPLPAVVVAAAYLFPVYPLRHHLTGTVIVVLHHRVRARRLQQPARQVIGKGRRALAGTVCPDRLNLAQPVAGVIPVFKMAAVRRRAPCQSARHIVTVTVHPAVIMPFFAQPATGVKLIVPRLPLAVGHPGELRFRIVMIADGRAQRVGRFQQVIKRPIAEQVTLPQRIRHRGQIAFRIIAKAGFAAVFVHHFRRRVAPAFIVPAPHLHALLMRDVPLRQPVLRIVEKGHRRRLAGLQPLQQSTPVVMIMLLAAIRPGYRRQQPLRRVGMMPAPPLRVAGRFHQPLGIARILPGVAQRVGINQQLTVIVVIVTV